MLRKQRIDFLFSIQRFLYELPAIFRDGRTSSGLTGNGFEHRPERAVFSDFACIQRLKGQLAGFSTICIHYIFENKSTISIAVSAASQPLFPDFVPARSTAWSMESVV